MTVRNAVLGDLDAILAVYAHARIYMEETGNPTQWGKSYPPESTVREDIARGALKVIEEEGVIYGVFAFFITGDPTYDRIEGEWLNDLPHAAIHRVASSGERRGMLGICMEYCGRLCDNLKIDTHENNTVMQKALEKQGFVRCGRIFLENGEPRIAYQRYRG